VLAGAVVVRQVKVGFWWWILWICGGLGDALAVYLATPLSVCAAQVNPWSLHLRLLAPLLPRHVN